MKLVLSMLIALSSSLSWGCYYDFSDVYSYCSFHNLPTVQRVCSGYRYIGCDQSHLMPDVCGPSDCCLVGSVTAHIEQYKVCPNTTPPPVTRGGSLGGQCQEEEKGSIVRLDSQSLAEVISLTGIPFTLNYSSERTKGRRAWYQVLIPITHSNMTIASSILREELEVSIAGQIFATSFSPSQGITYNYIWDGKDSLGNPISGSREAIITVTEIYNFTPSQLIPRVSKVFLGSVFESEYGMGGWEFSVHHTYDPVREILYLGDGDEYTTKANDRPSGEHWIISQDRSEVYVFDSSYKHIKTKNSLIGSTKLTFSYDSSGKLISVKDAYNNETTIQYVGGNLSSITSPYGQVTTTATDSNGYISTITNPASESYVMTYNPFGLLLTFEKPSGVMSTMTYDSDGLLLTNTSSEGSSSTLTRTVLDNLATVTHTSALGKVKTLLIDGTNASLSKTVIDEMGTRSRSEDYVFNSLATSKSGYSYTRTQKNDPWFGSMFRILDTESIYNNGINKIISYSEVPVLTTAGDPLSLTSLLQTTSVNGKDTTSFYTASTKTVVTTTPEGRTRTTILNDKGDDISHQVASFTPITMLYDSYGRASEIAQGSNRVTTLTYSSIGLLSALENALGQINYYTYDSANRLSTHTLADSRVILYSYDANGNISSITPPGKLPHSFVTNGYDLLAEYNPPLLPSIPVATNYTYNNDRQLIQIERPSGETITRNFNPYLGQLYSEVLPTGLRTYSYDYYNGRLNQSVSEDSFSRGMTTFGESLVSDYMWGGDLNYSITYFYNSDFQISSESLYVGSSSMEFLSYSYDNDGLVTEVGTQALTRSSETGLISQVNLDNVRELYTYSSSFGELSSLKAKYGSSYLYQEHVIRDDLGRIVTKTEQYGIGTSNIYEYIYDLAGRLTTVNLNGNPKSSYIFDSNSNRTAQTLDGIGTTATYDNQDRLLTFGAKSFTYNPNGDVATVTDAGVTTTFNFDVMGNLKSWSTPAKTISYQVDAHNRRVAVKDGATVKNYFIWNSLDRVIGMADSSGALTSRFVYGTKSHVPDYMIQGGDKFKIITNHLGSPVLVVNSVTGAIAQEVHYDDWGNILSDTNPGFTPFGFAGCLYDQDTKLCRFGARDYDASIGRWLSKDPILFAGGDTNLYGYVMQDPVNYIDPTGNIRLVTPYTPFTSFLSLITGGPEGLNTNEDAELQKMLQEKRFPPTNNPPISSSFPLNKPPSSLSNVCTPGNTGPTISSGI